MEHIKTFSIRWSQAFYLVGTTQQDFKNQQHSWESIIGWSDRLADKVIKSDMIDSGPRQDHTPIVMEIEL